MSNSSPSQEQMDTFVQMSSLLTGFNASVLAPSIDPTDLSGTLYQTAADHTGSTFDDLLTEYQNLVDQYAPGQTVDQMTEEQKEEIGRPLVEGTGPDDPVAATARSIMKAWYLGSWYQPFNYQRFEEGNQSVISDQAYIQGLAWKVMQSHAMGYSTFTFGYWADDPPPLTDFTGNPAPTLGGKGDRQ